MKGTHQLFGDPSPAEGSVGLGTVVPARDRAEVPPLPATAWTNVVPFVRPHAETPPADAAPKIVVSTADRPAPDVASPDTRGRILALVVLSLIVHAGIYLITNREPEPMASIGLETISVDIILGDNAPSQTQSPPEPQRPEPQQIEPEKAENQTPPEQTATPEPEQTAPPEPQQPPPPETAAAPPQPTPPEPEPQQTPPLPPEPQSVAPVPPPEPQQTPLPLPEPQNVAPVPPPEPPKPEPPKQEVKPAPPKPAPKQETKPKPAPKHEAKPKPAPKREVTRTETPAPRTRSETPAPRSNAADGGAPRSANDANYRGLVAAHLARYKRFPAEAQKSGAQGSASVRFTVSGSGGVTSVSLVRGTGVAVLDQEAVAMVHRASPFPAPPSGRAVSFTVPVSYKMR